VQGREYFNDPDELRLDALLRRALDRAEPISIPVPCWLDNHAAHERLARYTPA